MIVNIDGILLFCIASHQKTLSSLSPVELENKFYLFFLDRIEEMNKIGRGL